MSVAFHGRGSAAADAARLLIRLGLAILFVGLPIAGLVSRGTIYSLLPVGAGSILCGTVIAGPAHGLRRLRTALLAPLGATAVFLAGWTGLSLLWTPFPGQAGEKFLAMVTPAVLAAVVAASLPEKTRPLDLYLLPFGVAATAVAALVLVLLGAPWFWPDAGFDETLLERTVITLIVLIWPALGALALREHWFTAAALAVLVSFVALVDLARIPLAAMGAGAFVFALELFFALGFFVVRFINLTAVFGVIFVSDDGRAVGAARYNLLFIAAMQWYWMFKIVASLGNKVGGKKAATATAIKAKKG